MTTSLKRTTCVLAIGITLSSGMLLGQEALPVSRNSQPSRTPSAQPRADPAAAFRGSIRRAIAEQRAVLSSPQQPPPAKQKSWAERHKGGLTAAVIAGAAFLVLLAYAHHTCAGDEC